MTMTPDLESYFTALHARRDAVRSLIHRDVSVNGWIPKANCCHANVDYYVCGHPELRAVRGWLIRARSEDGGCNYVAHSVFTDGREFYDITLRDQTECSRYPFVEHVGSEVEFLAVRLVRCDPWYPFPIPDLTEAVTEGLDMEDTCR